MTTSLQDVYLMTGQAASCLHVNRLTIRRWVKAGKLSGEVIGHLTLIPRADVERLAKDRERYYE